MTRFFNPYTGMLDPFTDWGAVNAGQIRFFLSVDVKTGTPKMQGVADNHKSYRRSGQGDNGENRVAATHVSLHYMIELQGLTREMLNEFYARAGMKGCSLKKTFGNSEDCTTCVFSVQDTVMESQEDAGYRIQAISNFEQAFITDEVDGQYKVTAKKDATDASKCEIAETIQSLLNIAKAVVKDWGRDTAQDHAGAGEDGRTGVQKQKKRKPLMPLVELAQTLSFPTDELENDDWVLAENIDKLQTSTLRTRRSEGEKIELNHVGFLAGSVLGRDPQGRVWWKAEEDSQKVFYYRTSLRHPVTRSTKKPPKKARKK